MADPIDQLAEWVGPLLQQLAPAARKAAMQQVANFLRTSQVQRIASQRNPDGSPYEPRRPREQLQHRAGAIRRTMFAGLRKPKNLQRKATADDAVVAFRGNVSFVASVHQGGLRDKVDRRMASSPVIRYARRELLGFTEADLQAIENILLDSVTQG